MGAARVALAVGALVMAAALAYGFTAGGGWEEVGRLMDFPWFVVSLVDVYVGFLLFGGWILYRERSRAAALGWILALLTLGNLIACLYALSALARAGGRGDAFWLGHRAAPSP